jgi:hypothetical protein
MVTEGERAFILSSSAKYGPYFSNEDINLYALEISGELIKGEQRVAFRNYFLQRATLSQNLHGVLASLKGLQELKDVPLLKIDGDTNISLKSARPELALRLVSNFGEPF